MNYDYDVVIIGGGPAGLTAALYTGRACLKTLILEGTVIGGNAAWTDMIDNYPGFPEGINGTELMDKFWAQAKRFTAELKMETAVKIEPIDGGHKIITDQAEYLARAVIITAGARRKKLNVEGEEEFLGRGVSYCATCDGAFFKNAVVAIVGGGDSAIKEALYLSDIAEKIYLIHWSEVFRANKLSLEKMRRKDNIELLLNRVVKRIEGDALMQRLVLENVVEKKEDSIEAEGIFISIGLEAAIEFVEDLVETRDGYIITDGNMQTNVEGIFAAGDIRYKKTRQVTTAVGDGAEAGMSVTEYLKE